VNKPQKEEFDKLLIDIYWTTVDVMKGVNREQFIYTKHKYDTILQPKIKQLFTWYIRDLHDWNVSLGSHGKRIKDYVGPDIYYQYLSTYSANSLEDIPATLRNAKNFVTDIGSRLADSLGYQFPSDLNHKMHIYLEFRNSK
jgi:aminoglycoside 6-adenylyltransferase